MNVSLGLPTSFEDIPDGFLTGDLVKSLARAAEEAGFYSVHVADHPFPGDAWLATGGHHSPDPFVTLSYVAAVTTRLRVMTNIVVLPYRPAAVLAKAVATLDRLSDGRVILGVGAGYETAEFEALGIDFASRNQVSDETLAQLTAIWRGESVAGNTGAPVPRQSPRPPLWVGGNSRLAMRRAVVLADGWMPMFNSQALSSRRRTSVIETLDQLAARVDEAKIYCSEVGREEPLTISFMPLRPLPIGSNEWVQMLGEQITELKGAGVSHVRVDLPAKTSDEFLGLLDQYRSETSSDGEGPCER